MCLNLLNLRLHFRSLLDVFQNGFTFLRHRVSKLSQVKSQEGLENSKG